MAFLVNSGWGHLFIHERCANNFYNVCVVCLIVYFPNEALAWLQFCISIIQRKQGDARETLDHVFVAARLFSHYSQAFTICWSRALYYWHCQYSNSLATIRLKVNTIRHLKGIRYAKAWVRMYGLELWLATGM